METKLSDSIHRPDAHDNVTASHAGLHTSKWFKVPHDLTAKSFPFDVTMVEILASDSINSAYRTLVLNNLLSAPVWDEEKQEYLGFLDIGDLMALTYGMDLIVSVIPESSSELSDQASGTVASLFDSFDSAFSKWCPVYEDTSFFEVLRALAGHARRVPVLSRESGKIVKIISQSAVVAEVYKAIKWENKIPKEFALTPRKTGVGIKKVFTVGEDDPVKDAFSIMIKENVSAVGVLDDEAKLLSCVSTKDIRLLPRLDSARLSGRAFLQKSAREYVMMARRASEKQGKSHASVAVVGLDSPLSTAVGKLAETKMHRIFVVDENRKPVGVISVSDIINLLMEQALLNEDDLMDAEVEVVEGKESKTSKK